MRKIKKLLSIVFVLAIMASMCIIPASAAVKDDDIEPCATQCSCGGKPTPKYTYYISPIKKGACVLATSYAHYDCTRYRQNVCNMCGYEFDKRVAVRTYDYCEFVLGEADHPYTN